MIVRYILQKPQNSGRSRNPPKPKRLTFGLDNSNSAGPVPQLGQHRHSASHSSKEHRLLHHLPRAAQK